MPSMFASLGCGTSGLCAALRMQLSGQQVAMAIAGAVSCILAIAVALVTSTWGSDLRRRLRQIAVVWTCFSALSALGWKIPGAIYANQVARARAAVCARFDKLRGDSASPGAEEHALLHASLALHCSAHPELANYATRPSEFCSGVFCDSSYWGCWDRMIDVRLACDAADVFAPLRAHHDAAAADSPAPVVSSCELCRMLAAWRARPLEKPFVVLDLLPFPGDTRENHGTLTRGYDYACVSHPSARYHACRLAKLLQTRCGTEGLDDLVAMLDARPLIAWFTVQDTFMLRRRRGDAMEAHPKVFSIPLGLRLQPAPLYERAIDVLEARGPRSQPVVYSGSQLGVRLGVVAQLEALHGAGAIFRDAVGHGAFAQALLRSDFVASPPGMGADCYRHYEALVAGAIPIVTRTSIALSTLAALPVLVVDDYSVANASTLRHVARELRARVAAAHRSAAPEDAGPLAPLTRHFWQSQLRRASRHALDATRRRALFTLDAPRLATYVPGKVSGASLWEMRAMKRAPHDDLSWLSPNVCPCRCGLCWEDARRNGTTNALPTRAAKAREGAAASTAGAARPTHGHARVPRGAGHPT